MLMAYFDRIKSITIARKAMGNPGPMTNHDIPPLSGNSNVGRSLHCMAPIAVMQRKLLLIEFYCLFCFAEKDKHY